MAQTDCYLKMILKLCCNSTFKNFGSKRSIRNGRNYLNVLGSEPGFLIIGVTE